MFYITIQVTIRSHPTTVFQSRTNKISENKFNFYSKMGYDFSGKVALVTGAASGIGLGYTKSLIKNGVQGVAMVDINMEDGTNMQKKLGEKAFFIKTDVTKENELEDAFNKTITKFGHLDIVINNAGVVCERNWQCEISVNVNAAVQGVLLGFQYMRKDKGGRGGVILNTASVAGLQPIATCPVYGGTKAFIINFGRSIGTDIYYKDTSVKVLTLCPGKVETQIYKTFSFVDGFDVSVDQQNDIVLSMEMQTPEHLGDCMIEIIKRGTNGSCWVVTDNKPIFEYEFSTQKLF